MASTLETKKKMKITAINEHTVSLLEEGFDFDNKTFPITAEDQRNYLGLNIAALNQLITGQEMLDFTTDNRIKIKGVDIDGNTTYYLPDACSGIINFFMVGVSFVNETLQSGWVLKDAINNANSLEALALVVDNR